MFKYFRLLIVAASLFSFNSCYYNIIYKPTAVKPLFFTEKGDFNAGIDLTATAELNAAYAITDNLAVSASVSGINSKMIDTSSVYLYNVPNNQGFSINSTRFNDFELAFAYYKPMKNGYTFESFISYSYALGKYKNTITDINFNTLDKTNTYAGQYSRYFIQPAIGRTGKYFDYGIASRITLIDYHQYNDRDIIFEQLLFTRLGYKRFKLMFELGFFTTALYNSIEYDYSPFPLKLGVGFNYVLNGKTR